MASTTPETAPVAEKKTLFTTIVVSTPVVLTVVATFILGRSSAEMTYAQYHRSLAGQNQAKVGDQWAFFQAKRIRGTTYETTAATLYAQKADPFTADTLTDSAQTLIREIRLTVKENPKLEGLPALATKAEASLTHINTFMNPSEPERKAKIKSALDALEVYPKAKVELSAASDIEGDEIVLLKEILDDVRAFKPEKDVAPKTLKLKPDTLDKAMVLAKEKAAKTSAHGKAIDVELSKLDDLVDQQAALGRAYQRVLSARLSALANTGGDADETARLKRRLERVRDLSARLIADYKAARFAFDGQRYEEDARSHQDAAFLYDVYVLQSSARSDQHLKRSFGFMVAMLVAQVGVTVGSLALMLKYRMPAWTLAALAGIVAIAFGVCVFLEVMPILM